MLNQARQHIFISYSRSDRIAVDKLVEELRKQDYWLWMDVDERGIEPGEDWRNELKEQMSNAEAVIACISPDFLRSPFCQDEIKQAHVEGKPIFPVVVRRLDQGQSLDDDGMNLGNLQFVDFTLNFADAFKRLTNVLPPPAKTVERRLRQGRLLIGAIVGILALVAIVALGSVAGLSAVRPTATAPQPTPTRTLADVNFGIAVSPFNSVGDSSNADLGRTLARGVSDFLIQDLRDTFLARMTYDVLTPEDIETPAIGDPDNLNNLAQDIANDKAAELVVYGNLAVDGNNARLQPEFYVSPRDFEDAQEMTGNHRLGGEIRFISNQANTIEVQDQIRTRAAIMAQIFAGMAEYSLSDWADARDAFASALDIATTNNVENREVLHVLTGNAYLRLASEAALACNPEEAIAQLDLAEAQYQQAIDADERYSRGYSGMASAKFLRASVVELEAVPSSPDYPDGCNRDLMNWDLLIEAEATIEQAKTAINKPDEEAVLAKVNLTAAQIIAGQFRFYGDYTDNPYSAENDQPYYARFDDELAQIEAYYKSGENPAVGGLLAEAYAFNARMYVDVAYFSEAEEDRLSNFEAAADLFEQALAVDEGLPQRRQEYFAELGIVYSELFADAQALSAFESAIELAEGFADEASIEIYNEFIRQLRRESSGS